MVYVGLWEELIHLAILLDGIVILHCNLSGQNWFSILTPGMRKVVVSLHIYLYLVHATF